MPCSTDRYPKKARHCERDEESEVRSGVGTSQSGAPHSALVGAHRHLDDARSIALPVERQAPVLYELVELFGQRVWHALQLPRAHRLLFRLGFCRIRDVLDEFDAEMSLFFFKLIDLRTAT